MSSYKGNFRSVRMGTKKIVVRRNLLDTKPTTAVYKVEQKSFDNSNNKQSQFDKKNNSISIIKKRLEEENKNDKKKMIAENNVNNGQKIDNKKENNIDNNKVEIHIDSNNDIEQIDKKLLERYLIEKYLMDNKIIKSDVNGKKYIIVENNNSTENHCNVEGNDQNSNNISSNNINNNSGSSNIDSNNNCEDRPIDFKKEFMQLSEKLNNLIIRLTKEKFNNETPKDLVEIYNKLVEYINVTMNNSIDIKDINNEQIMS